MKYINPPTIPDVANLLALSRNYRLGSYPLLHANLRAVLRSYIAYRTVGGNAASQGVPAALVLPGNLAEALKNHYVRPPDVIEAFLDNLRERGSPDVCPMCGSLGTGTVDHVFPQTDFPELSFFSKNLVPACICNSKRAATLTGAAVGERILHPYFDTFLGDRLLRASITQSNHGFIRPVIDLQILIPQNHQTYPAVSFHVLNVIRNTQILAYFDATWPKLLRRPENYFDLPTGNLSAADFLAAAWRTLEKKDDHYETPNNWESILFAGIHATPQVCDFFSQWVNDIRNGVLNPDQALAI